MEMNHISLQEGVPRCYTKLPIVHAEVFFGFLAVLMADTESSCLQTAELLLNLTMDVFFYLI